MKKRLFNLFIFIFFTGNSFSQGFMITPPRLSFDGYRLLISYDLISKDISDEFYVWIEIQNKNGELLNVKALSGDVGEYVASGNSKRISWIPEKDNVFLNEEVTVEVKAEKYTKSFNRGSVILLSTALPGLGQTKISKGKPWWLMGVAAYGAMAGGIIVRNSSLATYDSYNAELDNPAVRADLYDKYNKQAGISNAMFISGTIVWVVNIIWTGLAPNPYQPLKHIKVSMNQLTYPASGEVFLALKFNF